MARRLTAILAYARIELLAGALWRNDIWRPHLVLPRAIIGEAPQAHKTQKHMQGRSSTQQPPATAKLDFRNRKTELPQPQNWNSATSKPANEMQKMACLQAAKQGSGSQHTGHSSPTSSHEAGHPTGRDCRRVEYRCARAQCLRCGTPFGTHGRFHTPTCRETATSHSATASPALLTQGHRCLRHPPRTHLHRPPLPPRTPPPKSWMPDRSSTTRIEAPANGCPMTVPLAASTAPGRTGTMGRTQLHMMRWPIRAPSIPPHEESPMRRPVGPGRRSTRTAGPRRRSTRTKLLPQHSAHQRCSCSPATCPSCHSTRCHR